MKQLSTKTPTPVILLILLALHFTVLSCNNEETKTHEEVEKEIIIKAEKPEYFSLRPEVEKAYGYAHAVKIGNNIKISGAVSMDNEGNPTAVGDLGAQMKNCYADLEKILNHYGCTFDDVIVENIFTTNMPLFLENAAYRGTIYTKHFSTGSWLGVKELAIPEFLIEIEMEAHKQE
ncbi:RidA family protein [Lacinutrix chionoecetis]